MQEKKPERLQRLEEIGLLMSKDTFEKKWLIMYSLLKEYRKKAIDTFGSWDGNVPWNHVVSFVFCHQLLFIYLQESHYDQIFKTSCGKNLGKWVSHQRTAKNNNTLKQERLRQLEEVGLV